MKTYYILTIVLDTDYSHSKRGKQGTWLSCHESQNQTKQTAKENTMTLLIGDDNKNGKSFKNLSNFLSSYKKK